ncbi:PrgI family protein [Flavobacterium branchiicola]|uniref:PrgI family protein n=1 Tax=Flavobacterium branchiicola TaxID=1114875 RepID=A0ABV9PD53_9FLAO|nr:PrgI family protein [Flavobacterium branchiicola]MBS7254222.1 PrgI family protein [Flavobacterium branchiicola]
MEDLKFIDPLLHGITPSNTNSLANVSVKHLVCAGLGSLLAGAILKKTGHNTSAAIVGSLALPLLTTACYKQIAKSSKAKKERNDSSGIEYNH